MNILETIVENKKVEVRNKKLELSISDLEMSDLFQRKTLSLREFLFDKNKT